MNRSGRVEKTEERLNYGIQFRANAALPEDQSIVGAGTFEIVINEKVRYKINYSIENKAALNDFKEIIAETMEEVSVIMKTTLGIVGHRVIAKTLRVTPEGVPNIETIERELHVPKLIDPNADVNPIISKTPLDNELLNRLAAAAPRMKEYTELLLELYALKTALDFTEFKSGFDMFLPRVVEAKKQASSYHENGDKAWPKRILREFPEYRHNAYDLILRLVDVPNMMPEKLLLAINATGATFSSSSHITLEMIARVCGSEPYQYSIKHLEAIKGGKHPRTKKTRKRKHDDSITRSEAITLISEFLAS